MPDSKDSCQLTGAQGDSTIAFAYIKVLKTRKKRFFVLKSVPKASPWEVEGAKPPMDYYLHMYKTEKNYQKNEPKYVYNLSSVILLSKCTKKDNSTVLGICFQEDALFLKFASEDELNRWYFHLSEIYSVKRNCRWPELLHCFSVTLKPKDLASDSARHGKPNLAGQYRFCITDSAVLLVRDSLLSPALFLPFGCIRSLAHSVGTAFFRIHLGRLSPIGEGVLHFEVEQSCMLKEIAETLQRCLKEASTRSLSDGNKIVNRSGRRSSRESVHRTGSFQTILRRGSVRYTKQHSAKSMSTFSERPSNANYSSVLSDDQRTKSQPLNDNFDDYCDLSRNAQPTVAISQSLNSSTSLSVNSELAGLDGSSVLAQQQQHPHQQLQQHHAPGAVREDSRASNASDSWRFDSLDACLASYEEALNAPPALGCRANSIGCRPTNPRTGSYLPSSYSVPSSYCGEVSQSGGGHRDDRQVFVEVSFRPRTTSDVAKYRLGGSRLRPRTGSYGNRSAYRLAVQTDDAAAASGGGCCVVPGDLGGSMGTELQSLQEATCTKEDDPYVPMSLGQSTTGVAAAQGEATDEEDPYWVAPSRLDCMLDQSASSRQQCPVEH